jgi:drug/metabolite transporter (DMT)-like permease
MPQPVSIRAGQAVEGDLTEQSTKASSVTIALTAITLIAFASNSVLCRLALAHGTIDPTCFTSLRILSGAATLWIISALLRRRSRPRGSWISASMLALYAFAFSYAYVSLNTGTGALILMGAVQATMIVAGIRAGERPIPIQWIGLLLALGGTVYLVSPGITGPPVLGSTLMAVAGFAWGVYSLRGRASGDPITATTDNFIRAVPIALGISLVQLGEMRWSTQGVLLALLSGSLTSGIGYVVWYAALRGLTATRAAVVQLAVPVIAAIGGVVFLSEAIIARLVIASLAVLGGVGLAVAGGGRRKRGESTRVGGAKCMGGKVIARRGP